MIFNDLNDSTFPPDPDQSTKQKVLMEQRYTVIPSPRDFPPQVPVIFFRFLGKDEFLKQRRVKVAV